MTEEILAGIALLDHTPHFGPLNFRYFKPRQKHFNGHSGDH